MFKFFPPWRLLENFMYECGIFFSLAYCNLNRRPVTVNFFLKGWKKGDLFSFNNIINGPPVGMEYFC